MQSKSEANIVADTNPCPLCDGTGFRMLHTEDGKGRKIEKVATCECRARSRAERLLAQARIPRRYEHCELSNFEFEGPLGSLLPARMAACRFAEDYPLNKTGLLLVGPIGVGKTHLAIGIIKTLMLQKGIPCLFYDYRELLKEIQNSYNASVDATELSVLEPVFDAEVLVLDELGAARPTSSDWILETVQFILNTRYNAAKTTIITTNYPDGPSAGAEEDERQRPLSQVEKSNRRLTIGDRVGDRIRSRMHEMCRIVSMHGSDYRLKYKRGDFD